MVSDVFLVIGAGSIGKRHAENLATLGANVELIPYREFDPESVTKRTDIAGLVIATATPIRRELIQLCADKNWPFYVEKPLAWTRHDVAELYEIAAPVADRSMIGLMMRYHPALWELAAQDLSDIYGFDFEIGHDVRQWRQNWSFSDSYAALPEGGGVLLDLCHELDMVQCLFPDIRVTSADCLGHSNFPGVDFATRISLTSDNGQNGTVAMDYLAPTSTRRTTLRGLNAAIDVDLLKAELHTAQNGETTTQRFEYERNAMFLGAMGDFMALAQGQNPSDNPLMPRFDRMRASCDLIASAWEARQFQGQVSVDMG